MPMYEFECETCGPFQTWRPMDEARLPAPCPHCHADGVRVYSPPLLYKSSPVVRKARQLEEVSTHEPQVVHREAPKEEGSAPRRKAVRSPHPWAVGHGH